MNKQIGISGVSVELNHSELVVLKGFVAQLKKLDDSNKYRYVETVKPMIVDMIVFLEKILPECGWNAKRGGD